jgi:GT2 family glycosyltransferase
MALPCLTISIVSHGQSHLIKDLISDLNGLKLKNVEIVITLNIPENESHYSCIQYPVTMVRNYKPKGFGENHNHAFSISKGDYFLVLNPDIRMNYFDVDSFLNPMHNSNVGLVGPIVKNSKGLMEDTIRKFPNLYKLIAKIFKDNSISDYEIGSHPFVVDWLAGMFMLFRREAFADVGGFDSKRFFMYYEDVDICKRLHKINWLVMVNPEMIVVHDAQRQSHKNLKHFIWHFTSAIRYTTGI